MIIDVKRREITNNRAINITHDHFLLHAIAEDMADRLQDFSNKPQNISVFNDNMGIISQHLTHKNIVSQNADAAISMLQLDRQENPLSFLRDMTSKVSTDGVLITTTFGQKTLATFKTAVYHADMQCYGGAGLRFMPMISAMDLARMATTVGLKNPIIHSHTYTAVYKNIFGLVNDLRAMNLGNILTERCKKPLLKKHLISIMQNYPPNENGDINAEFEILCLIAGF